MKLPCTLTWMPQELYFTCSHITLQVYRIRLFKPDIPAPDIGDPVTRPRETIILPDTASDRDVYYFPPADHNNKACVIVGSGSLPMGFIPGSSETPPIGCFLDEQKDLGGWIRSQDHEDIPANSGTGRLVRPLEAFDAEDDCDCKKP